MSAFVVEDKTINRVVTYLFSDVEGKHVKAELGKLKTDYAFSEKLSRAMFDLNVAAVRARYAGADEAGMIPPAFTFDYVPGNTMEVLKSLRCWVYQCTEDGIPETSELFKIMERYSYELAYRLVAALPEWDRAEGWN